MKQLIQNFKTGELGLEELPQPALKKGFVLVQNAFSLISPGTEKATVEVGQSSILGKAQKRPDLVKQVIANVKKEGVFQTLEKVKNKLDTPKALGYSCSGVVIDSRDHKGEFKSHMKVACAGQGYASHSEIVCVPQNLVTPIPENVSMEEASFTTLGAIALQGVRQSQARIGEKVCVIGLGLIGQLIVQILKANGCDVFGIDTSDYAVDLARTIGLQSASQRTNENLLNELNQFTQNHGFDKVIIAASSQSDDPIVLATEIARRKGVIVIVGDVKMNIPRQPHFYPKELELKISTSYGPGRYDPSYEEGGVDYPFAYVRFTENRNMATFLELMSKGAVDVKPLITETINFENATKAYDLILKGEKNFSGVLLKYQQKQYREATGKITLKKNPTKDINVGFIGAGSFAQSYLLPHLKRSDVSLDTVVNTQGTGAKNVAQKFGFQVASTNPDDIFKSEKINTVFISTRHDSHARYVCEALKAKKNVFVEKPLALNREELKEITSIYKGESVLSVGFNRRFAPVSVQIKKQLSCPSIVSFRVNAGFINDNHWIQDKHQGGGRILGEVCHFVDLLTYFSSSTIKKISAASICAQGQFKEGDNLVVTLHFENGSIGNIIYTSMGNQAMEKERCEIFSGGNCFVIDDFKKGIFYKNNRLTKSKNVGKGHQEEIQVFLESIRTTQQAPINPEELFMTTLSTFKIEDALKTTEAQEVSLDELYR